MPLSNFTSVVLFFCPLTHFYSIQRSIQLIKLSAKSLKNLHKHSTFQIITYICNDHRNTMLINFTYPFNTNLSHMIEAPVLIAVIIIAAIVFLSIFFHFVPFFLWLSAKVSGDTFRLSNYS